LALKEILYRWPPMHSSFGSWFCSSFLWRRDTSKNEIVPVFRKRTLIESGSSCSMWMTTPKWFFFQQKYKIQNKRRLHYLQLLSQESISFLWHRCNYSWEVPKEWISCEDNFS
jgi:hypothetical protein